jgi:hypothetical protein
MSNPPVSDNSCLSCGATVKRTSQRYCSVCRSTGAAERWRHRANTLDSPERRKGRLVTVGMFGLADAVSPDELEAALALDSADWGRWVAVQRAKLAGPRCSKCGLLEGAMKDGVKCWLPICALRLEPVDEAELHRYAGQFAQITAAPRDTFTSVASGTRRVGSHH